MHPGMPDVEDDATRPCLMHLRANTAIAVENSMGVTIQNVRGDIAGAHEVKDAHQGNGGVADVHHHLLVRGVSDLARHFQGRNGVGRARSPVVNTHLDAQDMLRVLSNTVNGLVDLGIGGSCSSPMRTVSEVRPVAQRCTKAYRRVSDCGII